MLDRVILLLLAVCAVRAQQQQPAVTVVKYESQPNTGSGEYSFSYELSDGSARSEQAVLQNAGTPDEFLLVTGSFRWTSPDGQVTQVDYTADDNGYHHSISLHRTGPPRSRPTERPQYFAPATSRPSCYPGSPGPRCPHPPPPPPPPPPSARPRTPPPPPEGGNLYNNKPSYPKPQVKLELPSFKPRPSARPKIRPKAGLLDPLKTVFPSLLGSNYVRRRRLGTLATGGRGEPLNGA
ncbi:endocuticle structural glycoprotein SgAbd-8-like [Thrips palmi]|uniref:Endocuticle structural glycoprotein SgAbd-8-like n=1 Tax=Thrips palmi TaxID=161013 RepID=A0A6P8ZK10_THRPL|nr:endocuticle structural glycoprotein SgAbd-8-like [Thrips palmi]